MRGAEPELYNAARNRVELLPPQRMYQCWLANILNLAAMRAEPNH
jgi:hypothetical protein